MLKLVKSRHLSESISIKNSTKKISQKKRTSLKKDAAAVNHEVISILEGLLAQAQTGELTGLMYVIRLASEDHGVGVGGTYLSDLHSGLSAFCMVYGLLGDKLHSASHYCD